MGLEPCHHRRRTTSKAGNLDGRKELGRVSSEDEKRVSSRETR